MASLSTFWNWIKPRASLGESIDRYYIGKLFGFGVFVHRIHGPDPEGIYHNHPWNCLSIIFGKYVEWTADVQYDDGRIVGITNTGHLRRWYNLIPAKRYHRVDIIEPVWTVVFHLPKSNVWSTINERGGIAVKPWEGTGAGRSYRAALDAVPLDQVRLDPAYNVRTTYSDADMAKLRDSIDEAFNPLLDGKTLAVVEESNSKAMQKMKEWVMKPDIKIRGKAANAVIVDVVVPVTVHDIDGLVEKGLREQGIPFISSEPIVLTNNNKIMDGNLRYQSALDLGHKTIKARRAGSQVVFDIDITKVKPR